MVRLLTGALGRINALIVASCARKLELPGIEVDVQFLAMEKKVTFNSIAFQKAVNVIAFRQQRLAELEGAYLPIQVGLIESEGGAGLHCWDLPPICQDSPCYTNKVIENDGRLIGLIEWSYSSKRADGKIDKICADGGRVVVPGLT